MDPDVDLEVAAERVELKPSPVPVLAVISAGGALGALARYGLATAWPHPATGFPWATWTINVSGSFLIGVLMVLIERRFADRRLIRPFFGVGILGGYTTFSTWMVQSEELSRLNGPRWAALNLVGSLLLGFGAVALGALA